MLDIVGVRGHVVLVRPVSVKGAGVVAVAGVGDAGGPGPGALVCGVRVRGHMRSSSVTRALGCRRAVRLSLVGGFCGSARPSCGKWRVVLQQRVRRETGLRG